MTDTLIERIKQDSYVPGREGLGGCHWYFSPERYTELLVKEIIDWVRMNSGWSDADDEAFREHMGLK